MGSDAGTPLTVRFGAYALDRGPRLLTRDGVALHLTPKAFDLLALLVAEVPRVVPKAELHARLWPQTFVTDATLSGVVKEVRRALDADGGPAAIRTVHGVGYAFAWPVEAVPRPAPTPAVRHWLVVDRRVVVLWPGENLIGREGSAMLALDMAGVSRRHARVTIAGNEAVLEDLGSKNGTRVGGAAITTPVRLRDGDAIHVGPAVVTYRMSSAEETSTVTEFGLTPPSSPE